MNQCFIITQNNPSDPAQVKKFRVILNAEESFLTDLSSGAIDFQQLLDEGKLQVSLEESCEEDKLTSVLKSLVDDYDQEGCSLGVGTVSTFNINKARKLLGKDLLEDEDVG